METVLVLTMSWLEFAFPPRCPDFFSYCTNYLSSIFCIICPGIPWKMHHDRSNRERTPESLKTSFETQWKVSPVWQCLLINARSSGWDRGGWWGPGCIDNTPHLFVYRLLVTQNIKTLVRISPAQPRTRACSRKFPAFHRIQLPLYRTMRLHSCLSLNPFVYVSFLPFSFSVPLLSFARSRVTCARGQESNIDTDDRIYGARPRLSLKLSFYTLFTVVNVAMTALGSRAIHYHEHPGSALRIASRDSEGSRSPTVE